MVVSNLEHQRENAGLCVIQVKQPAKEQRAHLTHGRPHRVPLLTENVPEGNGRRLELEVFELHLLYALGNLRIVLSRLTDPREVALHISGEHRHTDTAEGLGHYLQGDGLSGAGRASHEPVPVRHRGKQILRFFTLSDKQRLGHRLPLWNVSADEY